MTTTVICLDSDLANAVAVWEAELGNQIDRELNAALDANGY